jgi:hypothetical protein
LIDNAFFKHVAPIELIRKDFENLRKNEQLQTSREIQDLLLIQSIEGRSHNGSGVFSKRTYVNTTMDDIVDALNRDADQTKIRRQQLIDEIHHYIDDVVHGAKRGRLVSERGEPFIGFEYFRDRPVNDRDVLRGIYLGGLRDNAEIRKETEKRYDYRIGCGECYLVNIRVMTQMGLDAEMLAHDGHEDELESYLEQGLIVEDPGDIDPEDLRYYYIRHRVGPGQSDDSAVVVAGIMYNTDVALGVFLADAIDTLEKYVPEYKDQDQEIAYFIGRTFQDLGISMDDVYEMTYLSAIPSSVEEFVPDSSLRYLLAMDHISGLSTIESHLRFVENQPVPQFPISFKRILNTSFYEFIKKKLMNAHQLDRLAVPDIAISELTRPVREVARENCIQVAADSPLSDVIHQFKESKKELIVVLDRNQKVIGTLSATDLIEMSKTHSRLR